MTITTYLQVMHSSSRLLANTSVAHFTNKNIRPLISKLDVPQGVVTHHISDTIIVFVTYLVTAFSGEKEYR